MRTRVRKHVLRNPRSFKPSLLSALAVGLHVYLPRRMAIRLGEVLKEGSPKEISDLCSFLSYLLEGKQKP